MKRTLINDIIIVQIQPRMKGSTDMIYNYVLSLFLYFPEDKSEYLPAGITFLIFFIGAIITMRLIIKISQKEALKTKELEEKLLQKEKEN
jgi:hypothetical protein